MTILSSGIRGPVNGFIELHFFWFFALISEPTQDKKNGVGDRGWFLEGVLIFSQVLGAFFHEYEESCRTTPDETVQGRRRGIRRPGQPREQAGSD